MKFLFSILILIFLVGIVSSADLNFPFNQDIDIKRPCFNNGTYCSSSAVCNITILYPNGIIMPSADNIVMTNQGSFHNITILRGEVDRLGVHQAIMSCTDTAGDIAGNGEDTFTIEITGDGQSFNVFPTELIVFVIGLGLIGVGKVMDKLKVFKFIGAITVFIVGVTTIYPGYSFLNYSTLIGKGISLIGIGAGFFFLIEDAFSFDRQVEYYDQQDDGRFHE